MKFIKLIFFGIILPSLSLAQAIPGVGASGVSAGSVNGSGGGGGGGTPGGSTTQLQYNNAGSFGGTSGGTYDNVANLFTFSLYPNTPGTALSGSGSLAIGANYSDAISTNRTLTITGATYEDATVTVHWTVTGTPVLTIPASLIDGSQNPSTQTLYTLQAGPQTTTFKYENGGWRLYGTSYAITGNGGVFVQSNAPQIAGAILTGGLTASGSTPFDFSGSNATFKTSTGAVTLGGAATASSTLTVTGHTTFEGVTSTGATGTGALVYSISPAFTSVPTAPTATVGTNTTQLATTAFVLANAGSGSSGANPTASVGLTAVNGSATTFLRSDGAPALDQTIQPTWTGTAGHFFEKDALAAVTAPMITLVNTTAAANGAQQVSPALYFYGNSWMTTGATSTKVGTRQYSNGIQGSSSPVASWSFDYSINAGSTWTNALFFSSSSGFSFANTFTGTNATLSGTVAGNVVNSTTTASVGTTLSVGTNIITTGVGSTLAIKSGSNAKAGTFTLTSGAATVANSSITANSCVTGITIKTVSGARTTNPYVATITPGTGFTLAGGTATDNGTYNYVVIEVN